MKEFEGYIHGRGSVIVKEIPEWTDSIVDKNDLRVFKYLGKFRAQSLTKARRYFESKAGGKNIEISNEI